MLVTLVAALAMVVTLAIPPMSVARLMATAAWTALAAASLLSVRRCARSMAAAVAWIQWHRRGAPLRLAQAVQAATWAVEKLAMLWAAAQGTWRSGARWLTLGMPLPVAFVDASLLPVRRCDARSMLAAAAAWTFQRHRLCAPPVLALATQAATRAAVGLAMMLRAAAQEEDCLGRRVFAFSPQV